LNDSSITGKELRQRVAAGDQQAFSIFFHQHKQMVYQVAWTYTEHKELAEDILQDTFSIVWKKKATLPGIHDFSVWLYVVARNRSVQVLKKMAAEKKKEGNRAHLQRNWELDHTQQVSEKQMEALLEEAMALLSPRQTEMYSPRENTQKFIFGKS
jgi:RNA polymerase sigma factor (sigma-70 family)